MQNDSPSSLSISVVCFNSTELELQTLVSSLLESARHLRDSLELLSIPLFLIDNSEQQNLSLSLFDDLKAQLDDQAIELRLVHGHGNIGYGRGHNLVLEKLTSQYHLILNPDVRVERDCLISGLIFLQSNDEVGMISPYAEYDDGEKQYLCKRYPSVAIFVIRGFSPQFIRRFFSARLARFEMHDLSDDRPSFDVPLISGCFMLCRTTVLKNVNGFDAGYFLYFEDFDLSIRIAKLTRLAYVPSMRIQHDGGHAAGKGWSHLKMFASSGRRFFSTHGWRFFSQPS